MTFESPVKAGYVLGVEQGPRSVQLDLVAEVDEPVELGDADAGEDRLDVVQRQAAGGGVPYEWREHTVHDDYPTNHPYVAEQVTDDNLAALVVDVLKARKGDAFSFGYTGMLIEQCQTEDELPGFIRDALLIINEQLQDTSEPVMDDLDIAATSSAESEE